MDRKTLVSQIDFSKLSTFQKICLKTDGTLTDILEVYLSEAIHLVKLSEKNIFLAQDSLPLEVTLGREIIERKILLQGATTKKNWVYAESIIVPSRLDKNFRESLVKTQKTIGKLWIEFKLETFKEVVSVTRELAGDLSGYFKVKEEDCLLSRTYRVFSNKKPLMLITEKFPEAFLV